MGGLICQEPLIALLISSHFPRGTSEAVRTPSLAAARLTSREKPSVTTSAAESPDGAGFHVVPCMIWPFLGHAWIERGINLEPNRRDVHWGVSANRRFGLPAPMERPGSAACYAGHRATSTL